MQKLSGDQFRVTVQRCDAVVENMPNLFPVEEWRAFYWTLEPDGHLTTGNAAIHLPRSLGEVTPTVSICEKGIVEHTRRWGVTLRGGYIQAVES